jgi:mono/diheme cytochrome c family protein
MKARACAMALLLIAAPAAQASAAQDYMLHCMGCHGTHAQGVPGKVPSLANTMLQLMRTPEGRSHLLRAPGAANSALSDSRLAGVMNWLAVTYNPGSSDLPPFTTEEVARYRH